MTLRAFLTWVALSATCAAQTFQVGPVQVEAHDQSISILYHAHEWTPDLSKFSLPLAGCQPIAWDELNEIVYLGLRPKTETELTWLIVGYDLRADQASLVETYRGTYRGRASISPFGRYLVLIGSSSPHSKCQSDELILVDTETRRLVPFQLPDRPSEVSALRWPQPTSVSYTGSIRPDCGVPARSFTGVVDLAAALAGSR